MHPLTFSRPLSFSALGDPPRLGPLLFRLHPLFIFSSVPDALDYILQDFPVGDVPLRFLPLLFAPAFYSNRAPSVLWRVHHDGQSQPVIGTAPRLFSADVPKIARSSVESNSNFRVSLPSDHPAGHVREPGSHRSTFQRSRPSFSGLMPCLPGFQGYAVPRGQRACPRESS